MAKVSVRCCIHFKSHNYTVIQVFKLPPNSSKHKLKARRTSVFVPIMIELVIGKIKGQGFEKFDRKANFVVKTSHILRIGSRLMTSCYKTN